MAYKRKTKRIAVVATEGKIARLSFKRVKIEREPNPPSNPPAAPALAMTA